MPYFGTGESRGYGGSASGGKSARLKRKLRLKGKFKTQTPPEETSEFKYKNRRNVQNDIQLYYGNGEIKLESDGLFGGMQIKYEGIVSFEADLPENWIFMGNENKLIFVSFGATELPSILCTYKGGLKITSCIGYSLDGRKVVNVSANFNNPHYIELLNSNPENITSNIEKMNVTHEKGGKSKFKIRSINNFAKKDEFYYKDGTPVETNMPIHYDERFRAISGGIETKESKPLFRKDAKGKLQTELKEVRNGRYNNK